MSQTKRPTGHLQVKLDKNGRTRSFWVFWRDGQGRKGGRCLGPAHVRDSGRRTARGAVIWRAGHGPAYLTPKEAQIRLETIIEDLRAATEVEQVAERTLQQAVEGWLAEREGERGLKPPATRTCSSACSETLVPTRRCGRSRTGACARTSPTSSPIAC